MRIIGLDLSLRASGVAIWENGAMARRIVSAPPAVRDDQVGRLQTVINAVKTFLAPATDIVVIEDFAFSRGNQAHLLGGLGYAIRLYLRSHDIPFVLVGPMQNKKFASGSGKAEKSGMLLAVYKRWGIEAEDDNVADAVSLCMIGRALVGNWQPTADFQREVLKKVLQSNSDVLIPDFTSTQ